MLILRALSLTAWIPDQRVRTLVQRRFSQICADEPYDEVRHGYMVVVEPGDSASNIEQAVGFPILTSIFDGLPFDHPDYYPPFEIMEEHHYEQCRIYELFIVASDSGAGTAIFVPDEEGIDANLLALCRSWATPAVSTP